MLQYGGKVGGFCSKIKTPWEKGSNTETPMRHKNGLKTSLPIIIIIFFENAKNLGRSDDTKRKKKGDGLISFKTT